MSNRSGGFIGQCGLKAPDAPSAANPNVGGETSLTLTITPPNSCGDAPITCYIIKGKDNLGNFISSTRTGLTGSITGLTCGRNYCFQVAAQNAYGTSPFSDFTAAGTPSILCGQQEYTTPGSYSWTAPDGVSCVSVVAIGGGGAGGGNGGGSAGSLGYKNAIPVTAGCSYTVVAGAGGVNCCSGGTSYFKCTALVAGCGGFGYRCGCNYCCVCFIGDGGGKGGSSINGGKGSGAGAGGYCGTGGSYVVNFTSCGNPGDSGSGAAGSGAMVAGPAEASGGGGGVSIYGIGSTGLGGCVNDGCAFGGRPGSGGCCGTFGNGCCGSGCGGNGGIYGGAGGGGYTGSSCGAKGALRIIWPGDTRQFPSTQTGDL